MPGLRGHLYGHVHGFRRTTFPWRGTEIVNVSATDIRNVVTRDEGHLSIREGPVFNYGTYIVIEIDLDEVFSAQPCRLWSDDEGWTAWSIAGLPRNDPHP